MIWIIHGDDYAKSRTFILNQQKKLLVENKREIKLSESSPKEILEAASSFDLFGKAPFIVLSTTDYKQTDFSKFAEVLKKAN